MKNLVYILLIVLCTRNINAQNNYFTLTTEKLQTLKTQAVNEANYEKAAELKKEITEREKETQKITDLEAELEKKVKAEDFEGAATLKSELNSLKEKKQRKETLRLEIEQALVKEDYEKIAQHKKELQSLTGEPVAASQPEAPKITQTPPPPPPVQTPPPAQTPPVVETPTLTPPPPKAQPASTLPDYGPSSTKDTRKKSFVAYSVGSYAPYGILCGQLVQKGMELIGSWRFTNNIFINTNDIKIENGAISDKESTWKYTGIGYYSYQGFNLGVSFRMFGNLDKVSGYFLPAIGIGRYRYMYDYTKTSGSTSTTTLLDKDKSGYNFTLAPVFLVNFKFINIHMGTEIGIPNLSQSNFLFGIGGAF